MEMGGVVVAVSEDEDLLFEILSRVRVKDLMRFRCVSRAWNSFMFNPTLIKLHLQRSSKKSHLLLTFEESRNPDSHREWDNEAYGGNCAAICSIPRLLENPYPTIDDSLFPLDENLANHFVFGSCNGLVCVREYFEGDGFDKYLFRFWNPVRRVMSHDSPSLLLHLSMYKTGIGSVKYGFGFDESCETYKVVAILHNVRSNHREVKVHCLGDGQWRMVLSCPAFPILGQVGGQFASGTLNWLALKSSGAGYRWKSIKVDQLVIFSYDLQRETYQHLSMPAGFLEVPRKEPSLGVLKGCLCFSHDHKGTHFVVWLMREFGNEGSWTELMRISYDVLPHCAFPPFLVTPLYMSENEDTVLLAYGGLAFVVYNRRGNTVENTHAFKHNTFSFFSYEYVESLVLPIS